MASIWERGVGRHKRNVFSSYPKSGMLPLSETVASRHGKSLQNFYIGYIRLTLRQIMSQRRI